MMMGRFGFMRSKEDIIAEFGISDEEFELKYQIYESILKMLSVDKDWNKDIRDVEQKFCTELEVKEGMIQFNQAILNRIICNYGWSTEHK
tara:strand:+ start:242 stop:511 length:270 start_codon:yes stop_codon:yes gene_type:complete